MSSNVATPIASLSLTPIQDALTAPTRAQRQHTAVCHLTDGQQVRKNTSISKRVQSATQYCCKQQHASSAVFHLVAVTTLQRGSTPDKTLTQFNIRQQCWLQDQSLYDTAAHCCCRSLEACYEIHVVPDNSSSLYIHTGTAHCLLAALL